MSPDVSIRSVPRPPFSSIPRPDYRIHALADIDRLVGAHQLHRPCPTCLSIGHSRRAKGDPLGSPDDRERPEGVDATEVRIESEMSQTSVERQSCERNPFGCRSMPHW